MPRVSEIGPENLPEDAREVFRRYCTEYGPFENQAKVFAHRPPAVRHIMGLLLDLADEAVLPKRYLEIALVVVIYMLRLFGQGIMRRGWQGRASTRPRPTASWTMWCRASTRSICWCATMRFR